jgi:hypothetical protein
MHAGLVTKKPPGKSSHTASESGLGQAGTTNLATGLAGLPQPMATCAGSLTVKTVRSPVRTTSPYLANNLRTPPSVTYPPVPSAGRCGLGTVTAPSTTTQSAVGGVLPIEPWQSRVPVVSWTVGDGDSDAVVDGFGDRAGLLEHPFTKTATHMSATSVTLGIDQLCHAVEALACESMFKRAVRLPTSAKCPRMPDISRVRSARERHVSAHSGAILRAYVRLGGGLMISRQAKSVAAIAAVTTVVLVGCAGVPDQGFGGGGITVVPGAGHWEKTVSMTNGEYMAATRDQLFNAKVIRFQANGTVDTAYANHGVLSPQCGEVTLAPDGRAFCFNDNADDVVTAFTAAGAPDSGFGGGSIHVPFMTGSFGSSVSPTGDLYLLFGANGGALPPPSLTFRRYNPAGQQDPIFVAPLGPAESAYVAGFGPGGSVFAVHDLIQGHYILTKFASSGAADSTFGDHGSIVLPPTMLIDSVAVDRFGGVAMLVQQGRLHAVLRYTPLGQADRTFGYNGIALLPELVNNVGPLTVDSQRRVLLTASRTNQAGPVQVVRFLISGQPDPLFGSHGTATFTAINGVSLLNRHVFSVSTDAANRPVLWLDPTGVGMPAVARLSG